MKENIQIYWRSLVDLIAERLNIDPNKQICTFRLKVVLTTVTVCMIVFGAAGFAVLYRFNGNDLNDNGYNGLNNLEPKRMVAKSMPHETTSSSPSRRSKLLEKLITIASKNATNSIIDDSNPDDNSTLNTSKLPSAPKIVALSNEELNSKTTPASFNLARDINLQVTRCPPGKVLVYADESGYRQVRSVDDSNGPAPTRPSGSLLCKSINFPGNAPWVDSQSTTPKSVNELLKELRDNPALNKQVGPDAVKADSMSDKSLSQPKTFIQHQKPTTRRKPKPVTRRPTQRPTRPRPVATVTSKPTTTTTQSGIIHETVQPNYWDKAIKINFCLHLCASKSSLGGELCKCDSPPMAYLSTH